VGVVYSRALTVGTARHGPCQRIGQAYRIRWAAETGVRARGRLVGAGPWSVYGPAAQERRPFDEILRDGLGDLLQEIGICNADKESGDEDGEREGVEPVEGRHICICRHNWSSVMRVCTHLN
jgi:hypothetical protein